MDDSRARRGFAVIDFETTGLSPARGSRAIEIGVVLSDRDGAVTEEHDTLIHAGPVVGPTRIHRISSREVAHAPTFRQIAPRLVELLAGRVIVAHNAGFDLGFLRTELLAAGYTPGPVVSLCTMQLARHFLPDSRRSLRACCEVFGIDLRDAHRASADARATATLLECYIASSGDRAWWDARLDRAAASPWPPFPAEQVRDARSAVPSSVSVSDGRAPWMPREIARAAAGLPAVEVGPRVPTFV
ncbi:PolC-type DNA polymerase III [Cnuibacter sp. UC19_7]|uniref:3'-5' exonuclease n=1 Tax=Cnuibacter sp. UC19_7 TaxID=3350166 RepID=UPI00366A80EF